MKLFLDSETVGLVGPIVLFQYALEDGEINLWEPFLNPVEDTLKLYEYICQHEIIGFNLVFDHFHICKQYTTFWLYRQKFGNIVPSNFKEVALCEEQARFLNFTLKPKKALDLMLYARTGPFQALMKRKPIVIRKVPTALALELVKELDSKIPFDAIFFAGRKKELNRDSVWRIDDVDEHPELKDITLEFNPSGKLKTLAKYILGEDEDNVILHKDIALESCLYPEELGYAPFGLATTTRRVVGKEKVLDFDGTEIELNKYEVLEWKKSWPNFIGFHIDHWHNNLKARQYGTDDIKYTRGLYHYFKDNPRVGYDPIEIGDDNSELACAVASARWHGYSINLEKISKLREKAHEVSISAPKAPAEVKRYLYDVLTPEEKIIIQGSTRKEILEELAGEKDEHGNWKIISGEDDSRTRSQKVLDARSAKKEEELYDKLIEAGRFHASLKVIGSKSSRMAGDDDLNPQAIKNSLEVRDCFDFIDSNSISRYNLFGGDFDSFEVSIAEAEYNDPELRKDLLSGKKVHALVATELFPEMDYDDIIATKGSGAGDKYDTGKKVFLSWIYGGDENTAHNRYGIELDQAKEGYDNFVEKYQGVKRAREKVFGDFCSMRQPNGLGTRVEWHEPKDFVESMLGFKRFFTLENRVCKALFDLANKPPAHWQKIKIKVTRRSERGPQTGVGATLSALYACAFNIQSANMRAAANHKIQATGGQITKAVQRAIWDLQPIGVAIFIVQPINIHDELLSPVRKENQELVMKTIENKVNSFKNLIPLLKFEWVSMNTWADK